MGKGEGMNGPNEWETGWGEAIRTSGREPERKCCKSSRPTKGSFAKEDTAPISSCDDTPIPRTKSTIGDGKAVEVIGDGDANGSGESAPEGEGVPVWRAASVWG